MAYMNQKRKKEIVAACKPILAKYGVKATFSVQGHSTITCTIRSGKIDFLKDMLITSSPVYDGIPVNPYHYKNHFEGDSLAFLSELFPALNQGNWNNSRIEIDYFDVGWYVNVRIGRWRKNYEVTL